MIDEVWKDVPGFEGYYQVSSLGRVRSRDRLVPRKGLSRFIQSKGSLKKPVVSNAEGHLKVHLYREGRAYQKLVHRLVLEAFKGPPPPGKPFGLHGDGDPTNNNVSNLRWGNQSENLQDAILHGTWRNGTSHSDRCKRGHLFDLPPGSGAPRVCRVCVLNASIRRKANGLPEDDPRHGSVNGYRNYACRCEACRAASTRESQVYRRSLKSSEVD